MCVIIQEAKEDLAKAQKRSQVLKQLTEETQKAIEDENHFTEDLSAHDHSGSNACVLSDLCSYVLSFTF